VHAGPLVPKHWRVVSGERVARAALKAALQPSSGTNIIEPRNALESLGSGERWDLIGNSPSALTRCSEKCSGNCIGFRLQRIFNSNQGLVALGNRATRLVSPESYVPGRMHMGHFHAVRLAKFASASKTM